MQCPLRSYLFLEKDLILFFTLLCWLFCLFSVTMSLLYRINLRLRFFSSFWKFYMSPGMVFCLSILLILLFDGLLLDDEPLWEPLEWSVVQTWILYSYIFTWASEVIFSSRYGSFTNRDKVVWIGLFRTYYGLLYWFFINLIIVTVFVTLPFYFEITYAISYSVVWWNWLSSVFFFKFISFFSVILLLMSLIRLRARWTSQWEIRYLLLLVLFFLSFLFYFQTFITWFSFFTDTDTFRKSGWSELSRVTNGPLKWGWGSSSRDHFSYHKTTTAFWAKNDQLVLSSLLFINIFLFLFLFFLILQVIAYYWVLSYSGEISHNGLTYLYSTVLHFFYLILGFSFLVLLSLIYQFMRFPVELFYYVKFVQLMRLEGELVLDIFLV
uniref:Uncharacterized protein ORF380 n=1 Tax=Moneuplotes minuta TaxID=74792 RepID=D1LDQ5_9SPIT|nr:hypothetical protein [Moneuplotes minuta]